MMFTCGDFVTSLDSLLSGANPLLSWPVALLNPPLMLASIVVAAVYSVLGCLQ